MQLLPIIVVGTLIALLAFAVERQVRQRNVLKPPAALQAWGKKALQNEAAKAWLAGLEEGEANRLVKRLTRFGRRSGFDVQWLLHNRFGNDETLREKANAMAVAYVMASWQQLDMQADLQAHRLFLELKRSPNRRKHRALVLDLYARLIEANLTPAPSVGDAMRLNDRKRRRRAINAIMESAEKNRAAFNTQLIAAIEVRDAAAQARPRRSTPPAAAPPPEVQPAAS